MRCVVQRVTEASVSVDGQTISRIQRGLVVLVGITHTDTEKEGQWMADKLLGLRIFSDSEGKMNLSVSDNGFQILIISQFTLYGDCKKGKRPSFIEAANPVQAEPLVDSLVEQLKKGNLDVQTGQFGADMSVSLINDGPVTVIIDTSCK